MKTVIFIEKNDNELIESTYTNIWAWKIYYDGSLKRKNIKKIILIDNNNNSFELNANNLIRFEADGKHIILKNEQYEKYCKDYDNDDDDNVFLSQQEIENKVQEMISDDKFLDESPNQDNVNITSHKLSLNQILIKNKEKKNEN